jgi:hypothetical protein
VGGHREAGKSWEEQRMNVDAMDVRVCEDSRGRPEVGGNLGADCEVVLEARGVKCVVCDGCVNRMCMPDC